MTDTSKEAITPEYLRKLSEKLRGWPDKQSDVGPAHAATVLAWVADELDAAKAEVERLTGFIQDEVINDSEGDLDLVRWKATRALKGQTYD